MPLPEGWCKPLGCPIRGETIKSFLVGKVHASYYKPKILSNIANCILDTMNSPQDLASAFSSTRPVTSQAKHLHLLFQPLHVSFHTTSKLPSMFIPTHHCCYKWPHLTLFLTTQSSMGLFSSIKITTSQLEIFYQHDHMAVD